jgi:hypothetical protein
MRTTLLAAVVATGLGIAPAFADNASGYVYPNFWGDTAQQQVPAAQAPTHSSSGASIGAYVTQSSHGTWLFPPNPNQGANG